MDLKLYLLIFAVSICCAASSQETLKGVVRSAQTGLTIENVSVRNLATKQVHLTDRNGLYSIRASEDDTIIFSITSYTPDTLKVTYGQLITSYDPELQLNMVSLKGVTVRSNYQLDSINRAASYRELKGGMRGITGGNRPTDGVGISISPLSYFSQRAKQQRQAKKRMETNEETFYVDDKFSPYTVARLTKLQGDSLSLFLYMYRPSYKKARRMDRDDMIEYISDKLILFRNRSKEQEH
ncbi:MAG: hypothetical protein EOO05_03860 [Chitinophagaceae bacterium]|nr:MAG: hypothetical protein EOO05_03860 [Chitinophagaceae bacterium]